MKRFTFFFFALFLTTAVTAQSELPVQQMDVQEWASLLQLDAPQMSTVKIIEQQRNTQLVELSKIKSTDSDLYQQKLKAIDTNALAKLQNILRPEQLNKYRQQIMKQEQDKVALAKKMQSEGASKGDIDRVLNNN